MVNIYLLCLPGRFFPALRRGLGGCISSRRMERERTGWKGGWGNRGPQKQTKRMTPSSSSWEQVRGSAVQFLKLLRKETSDLQPGSKGVAKKGKGQDRLDRRVGQQRPQEANKEDAPKFIKLGASSEHCNVISETAKEENLRPAAWEQRGGQKKPPRGKRRGQGQPNQAGIKLGQPLPHK